MSDFIFPFASVHNLNDLIIDELLPFDYFNSLVSLNNLNRFNTQAHNHVDTIDEFLCNQREIQSNYFDGSAFGDLPLNSNSLSLLFCNINSSHHNLDNFSSSYLNKTKPMFVALCETKCSKNTENLYKIDGYSIVSNSRNSHGGGVAIYSSADISINVIQNLCFMEDYIETLCISFKLKNELFYICVVYRKPGSNFEQFLDKYEEILRVICRSKCIVCGDFNLDLLKYENSKTVEAYVNLSFQFSLFPFVNRPTRVSTHSASVIDHIWCNFLNPAKSGILLNDTSDHFAPFLWVPSSDTNEDATVNSQFTYRKWKNAEQEPFREQLSSRLSNFQVEVQELNIDAVLDNLVTSINDTIEEFCPLKTSKSGKKPHKKPWLTDELESLTREKNRLFTKY